jgi:hypothetical protein
MHVIERSTVHANIRVVARASDVNREWLYRHALHQLLKGYRLDFGTSALKSLMDELNTYHSARTVGM